VILCDTGPLVAAFNEADSDHARCAEFLAGNWSRLVIPSLAVTEVCHLLSDPQQRGRVGLAAEFCAAIADDELRVIEITPHDYRRMAELLTTYSSLRLQVVDACVVALAERLDLREVDALDRRDFQVVAPRHLPKRPAAQVAPGRLTPRTYPPLALQDTTTFAYMVADLGGLCSRFRIGNHECPGRLVGQVEGD